MAGYLRFFLAALVVSYHLGYRFAGQGFGVPSVVGFYVLSGSVVASLVSGPFAGLPLGRFFAERLLRIYPTYYYFFGLALAFVMITGFGAPEFTALNVIGNLAVIPLNYVCFPQFVMLGDKGLPLIPTAWSLGAELQAYLVLGFSLRCGPRTRLVLGASSLVVFAAAGAQMLNSDLWGYRLLPGIFFMFLAGSYLAAPKTGSGLFGRIERWFPALSWIFVAALSLRCSLAGKHDILPVSFGFIIGLPLVALVLRVRKHLPINHLLGDLSYGIFLAHIPVLWFFEWAWPSLVRSETRFWPVITLSIILSLISVYLIERPIWQFRKLLSKHPMTAVSLCQK